MALVTTGQAAIRLGITKPTVRKLIVEGRLGAVREPRGRRFRWMIDENEVRRFLSTQGPVGRRPARQSRLDRVEEELASIRSLVPAVPAGASGAVSATSVERERDDLRAEVVRLREALTRVQATAELNQQADRERAEVIRHLFEAAAAWERVDDLRRKAISEYEETVAAMYRPGHPGQMR